MQARTRRGGKIIGTTLKTLFSRLNTDVAIKQLNQVGVATFSLTGEFRSASQRLDELSIKWSELNSVQRNNIAFAIAGRRQYSQFLALMQGYQQSIEAARDATQSQGSAFQEQEKILETIEKKIATFHSIDVEEVRKVGGPIIHWIPKIGSVSVELVQIDGSHVMGLAEPSLAELPVGTFLQFERVGFARIYEQGDPIRVSFAHK